MNIYDPMDRIVYRHLDQRCSPGSDATGSRDEVKTLPSGYANRSPGTYLGRARRSASAA